MKTATNLNIWRSRNALLTFFGLAISASAQNYSIDWHKIAGGGGTSTNGQYAVTGTIGQPDASLQQMSGGNYSLTGGFWSLISVVQAPGAPILTIHLSGGIAIVSWPAVGNWSLEQSAVMSGGWAASGYTVSTMNGTNSVAIANPTGNLFLRLKR